MGTLEWISLIGFGAVAALLWEANERLRRIIALLSDRR